MKITASQMQVLTEHYRSQLLGQSADPGDIAARSERTPQSVHQTAASLVKHGALRKFKSRPVHYEITTYGIGLVVDSKRKARL